MAQKKEAEGAELQAAYTKLEHFINENSKLFTGGLLVIALAILGLFFLKFKVIPDREANAQKEMFLAQNFFERDSFQVALNGNIEVTGFEEIIQNYKWSNAANLSRYYAGICNLHLGNYDEAISNLKKFKLKDKVVGAVALSALGDAYMENGDTGNGLKYYKKAAAFSDDELTSPMLIMKAGQALQINGKNAEAKKYYERIKKDFPNSQEALEIDKYIARVSNGS